MEMEIESQNTDDVNDITKVLSVQNEDSVIREASKKIDEIVQNKANSKQSILASQKKFVIENSKNNESSILKTQLQKQVETGEITPFQAAKKELDDKNKLGKTLKEPTQLLDFEKYLQEQAELANQRRLLKKKKVQGKQKNVIPTKKKKISEFNGCDATKTDVPKVKQFEEKRENVISTIKKSNDSIQNRSCIKADNLNKPSTSTCNNKNKPSKRKYSANENDDESGSEYFPSDDYDSDQKDTEKTKRKKKACASKSQNTQNKRVLDDGDEDIYKERVESSGYKKNEPLHKVDKIFKVPQKIWKNLFKYQRVAVEWLWELHSRNLGGLLGDEMGLGKTVQVIAFLAGLDCSDLLSDGGRFRGLGPTIIVCPATLLEQWVKHFHDWWPTFRVVMFHQSGTFQGDLEELLYTMRDGGILVISYTGVVIHQELLTKFKWQYVILDEGHKIRNPEAKASKVVKRFLTPHRLLLTGSPMQNSLKELWSLFDFILPGKLGTLPAFMEHCAGPITRGGYANASRLQEITAFQVATMLKEAITPYMLRRTKYDVQHHINLPTKNEQVLFCSLTEEQRELYEAHLRSEDVSMILHQKRGDGQYRARMLVALTALRKICNHPDLYLYDDGNDAIEEDVEEDELQVDENASENFGHWKRSGKMTVVRSLLKIWKKQGHRALLFTQSRQMLYVLESLILKENYTYLRMDGTTPMSQRQSVISKFNNDENYFIFLLTTRVGGLGVNLTGANRVIIYDPDWNPATDAQARERSWRIGQDKDVTIYRLITAGTIEEKMYHRQVFKILLSNRVLEDPRQRRLFHTSELTELFNLNVPLNGDKSESDKLFRSSKVSPGQPNFSSSKIEAMKKLASELSKKIAQKASSNSENSEKSIKRKKNQLEMKKETDKRNVDSTVTSKNNKTETITKAAYDLAIPSNINSENIIDENINKTAEDISVNTDIENKTIKNKNKEGEENHDKLLTNGDSNDIEIDTSKTDVHNSRMETSSDHQITANKQDCLEEGEIKDQTSTETKKRSRNKIEEEKKETKRHKKSKKQKKIKSENTVSALFEGERISCLIGRRLGKPEQEPVVNEDDQYVLSKLFSKSAVCSAFQHESVLSNAVLNPDEETPLQRAAKKEASEKMDHIRQSRKWCWRPGWDNPPEEQEEYADDDENIDEEEDDE
ncbi:DNA excision repair protein ERCC-6-like [Trichogramma pretiosum]|uniref:DNA excision repair protein ERCC-6-like n=1 Tax=Trichogramma pretiosum TaxID=7493 RepID=UPI0006C99199|nr:DNA excision repair protein ERCC-6-like [Trichogramma pretiosum]